MVKFEVSSLTIIPNNGSWEEVHMLQEKASKGDFCSVCVKTLTIDSRTSYELGLVKVVGLNIVSAYSTFLKPNSISKAMQKKMPESLWRNLNDAPKFEDVWPTIRNFFDSNVLYGSEASTRRLSYISSEAGVNIAPQALPTGFGPTPMSLKMLLDTGSVDSMSALDYACEWAVNRIQKGKMSSF